MGRCCCGRYNDLTETLVVNDYQHELLGVDGAFCGPKIKHDLRDAWRELGKVKRERDEYRDMYQSYHEGYRSLTTENERLRAMLTKCGVGTFALDKKADMENRKNFGVGLIKEPGE